MARSGAGPRLAGLALVAGLVGCSNSSGPGSFDVSGHWTGIASLPNGRSTSADLQQTGTAASGTMTVAGAFVSTALTGQVSSQNRTLTWTLMRGCEVWGGVATVTADGGKMSGPVDIDRSGCQPAQSDGSGTLTLTRQ